MEPKKFRHLISICMYAVCSLILLGTSGYLLYTDEAPSPHSLVALHILGGAVGWILAIIWRLEAANRGG